MKVTKNELHSACMNALQFKAEDTDMIIWNGAYCLMALVTGKMNDGAEELKKLALAELCKNVKLEFE